MKMFLFLEFRENPSKNTEKNKNKKKPTLISEK
jgi:hypothetical protein